MKQQAEMKSPEAGRVSGAGRGVRWTLCLSFMVVLLVAVGPRRVVGQGQSSLNGQTPAGAAPGTPAGSYSLSNIESVALYSGRVNATIPLVKIGGRGSAGYTMSVSVDQSQWVTNYELGDQQPFPSDRLYVYDAQTEWFAWSKAPKFEPVFLVQRTTRSEPFNPIPDDPGGPNWWKHGTTAFVLTTADGSEHFLYDVNFGGLPTNWIDAQQGWQPSPFRGRVFTARDGSGITFVADAEEVEIQLSYDEASNSTFSNQETTANGFLRSRDGTTSRIEGGLIRWMRDRNGNLTTFERQTNLLKITDANGRVTKVNYNGNTITITYLGFGSTARTITLQYGSLSANLKPNSNYQTGPRMNLFPHHPVNGISTGFTNDATVYNPTVLSSITLADGVQKYQFYYNPYGELARMETPLGGAAEYDYSVGVPVNHSQFIYESGQIGGIPVLRNNQNVAIYRRLTQRRDYANGGTVVTRTTNYGQIQEGVSPGRSKVRATEIDRDGVTVLGVEDHYFIGNPVARLFTGFEMGYPTSAELEGKEVQTDRMDLAGNIALERVEHEWTALFSNVWAPYITATRKSVRVVPSSNYLVSKTEYEQDNFSNLTEVREFDFGNNQPGALKRRTHTTFVTVNNGVDYTNPNLHLRGLPAEAIVYERVGSTEVARSKTVFEYDNYNQNTSDSFHHVLNSYGNIFGLDSAYDGIGEPEYYPRGNLTRTRRYLLDSLGNELSSVSAYLQYDIAGNVVKQLDPRSTSGHLIATSFDFADCYGTPVNEALTNHAPGSLNGMSALNGLLTYAFPKAVTNAKGHVALMQYDYGLGAVVKQQEPNGTRSSQEYGTGVVDGIDEFDRPSKSIQGINTAIKVQSKTEYDDGNRLVTVTSDLTSYEDNVLKRVSFFDGLGRTFETRSYETAIDYVTTKSEFDGLGRVIRTYNPYRTNTEETYGTTELEYDELGRVKRAETFDRLGVSTGKVLSEYSGNLILVIDQADKKRLSRTNGLGQLTDVWELTTGDSQTSSITFKEQSLVGYLTQYEYDTLGNLAKVKQGTQANRTYAYNSLAQLTEAFGPEHGTITYDYDPAGNMLEKSDALRTVTYIYDDLSRIGTRSYNDGTPTVTYAYDNATVGEFGIGRLASVSNSVSTYTYSKYDELGRVKEGTQVTDGASYLMTYNYNLAGQMISQQYPSGRLVKSEYDTAGRLAGVMNDDSNNANDFYYAGGAATDQTNRLQYAATGGLQVKRLGNGLWEHTNFNARGQVTQIGLGTAAANSNKLQLDYTYGVLVNGTPDPTKNNGNLQRQTITVPKTVPNPEANLTLVQNYTYDELNRLQSATELNGTTSIWKQTYSYDRFGNRTFDTSNNGTTLPEITPQNQDTTNPTISGTNNQLSSNGYRYDAVGNLKCDPVRQCGPSPAFNNYYQYDGENRLKRAGDGPASGGSDYFYDGDGRRIKKIVGGAAIVTTIFVYDVRGNLVAEYSNAQALTSGTNYVTSDTLGTPRVITKSNKEVLGRHDYQPFGEEIAGSYGSRSGVEGYPAGDGLHQQFTSKERDSETGFDYFGARYYASGLGRFTSPDPLMASARPNDPQTWNRVVFVLNNPLRFVDPDGMDVKDSTRPWDQLTPEEQEIVRKHLKVDQGKTVQEVFDSKFNGMSFDQKVASLTGLRMLFEAIGTNNEIMDKLGTFQSAWSQENLDVGLEFKVKEGFLETLGRNGFEVDAPYEAANPSDHRHSARQTTETSFDPAVHFVQQTKYAADRFDVHFDIRSASFRKQSIPDPGPSLSGPPIPGAGRMAEITSAGMSHFTKHSIYEIRLQKRKQAERKQ